MTKPAWILMILAFVATGCTTAWDSVDVTANPDVVKPCKRLGTVEPDKLDWAFSAQNRDWTYELKRLAHEKGGNTLFYTGSGHTGEAYMCSTPSVAAR